MKSHDAPQTTMWTENKFTELSMWIFVYFSFVYQENKLTYTDDAVQVMQKR